MRKELFSNEITILRDTFRRLLRRRAKTNIIKLIDKTHPADLALLFRYFNDNEQDEIFADLTGSDKAGNPVNYDTSGMRKYAKALSLERLKIVSYYIFLCLYRRKDVFLSSYVD